MNKKLISLNIKEIAWLSAGAIFFIGDRLLKSLAIKQPNDNYQIIGDIFTFHFIPNFNIAFSLPFSGPWLTAAISLIIVVIIIYLFSSKLKTFDKIAFFLILLGAISNLLDRMRYGFVIDYLNLQWFTVFNLADFLISLGTAILIFRVFKKSHD